MRHGLHIRILAYLTAAASILFSASPSDELTGPPGGWALAVVTDPDNPNVAYVGLHGGGVLMTRDSGLHWSEMNHGLAERTVIPILIDSTDPKVLYVGTESGIFKTVNAGEEWKDVSTGLTGRNVWSLAADSSVPQRIYAGTSGGGVFRSDDAGGQWKLASAGITNPAVWPLV